MALLELPLAAFGFVVIGCTGKGDFAILRGVPVSLARSTAAQLRKFDAQSRVAAKRFIKSIPNDALLPEVDIFCELFSRPTWMEGLREFVESRD